MADTGSPKPSSSFRYDRVASSVGRHDRSGIVVKRRNEHGTDLMIHQYEASLLLICQPYCEMQAACQIHILLITMYMTPWIHMLQVVEVSQ